MKGLNHKKEYLLKPFWLFVNAILEYKSEPGMVASAFNPSTGAPGQPWLQSETLSETQTKQKHRANAILLLGLTWPPYLWSRIASYVYVN